jgi:maleamate amidohydrolase
MYEAVRELYLSSGFGGRVGFGERPAIVVIDLARSWLDESSPQGSRRLASVLDRTLEVIAAGRDHGHPVFFTTMAYEKGDLVGPLGKKMLHASSGSSLDAGSPMIELDPQLRRRADEPLIVKQRASAFWGTTFEAHLVGRRIDTLIITGCSTSGCVRATAESAYDRNFHCIVAREAVGDRSPVAHECNLIDIDMRYGDVVEVDAVVSYLVRVAR